MFEGLLKLLKKKCETKTKCGCTQKIKTTLVVKKPVKKEIKSMAKTKKKPIAPKLDKSKKKGK